MNNFVMIYIFIALLTILDFIVFDIKNKRVSIVSIYIIGKILLFSVIIVIINALQLEYLLKIVTIIFTVWLDINFLLNAIINLIYKKEQKVNNVFLEIIYILISIAVIILLIKIY
ncbi:MAG: hypothetical protein IJ809_01535 [Clostridia bacterium]|nr:hypothetical protein [Clostridia bacterium]